MEQNNQNTPEELISLVEWAKLNNLDPSTVRRMARKGKYKTARKIGRNWVIDKNEKNIYQRRKKSK